MGAAAPGDGGSRSASAAAAAAARTAQREREGLGGREGVRGRRDEGTRERGAWDLRTWEARRPGPPVERGPPSGGAMPLAQLKEPWPLMELVPLDPEVSELGGGRALAAGEPESPQGRGGPRRLCSRAGARADASALRSLAPSPAPPLLPRVCVREGQFRHSAEKPLSPERVCRGALRSDPRLTPHT